MDGWVDAPIVNGVFFEEDNHDKSSLFSFFFLESLLVLFSCITLLATFADVLVVLVLCAN
jgi:hypothetical protein